MLTATLPGETSLIRAIIRQELRQFPDGSDRQHQVWALLCSAPFNSHWWRPSVRQYAEERRLFYVALTRTSRGAYLRTNSRQPSRYIRELCEIAGDEIRFETIEGAALRQCPKCLVGQMVEKRNRNGEVFSGCNQFPDCKHSEERPAQSRTQQRRRA